MIQQEDEAYLQQLGKMKRPIPGSSLTNDPENPLPFEGPPQFTKKKAALEEIFINMIKPRVYEGMVEALLKGTPVVEMTKILLMQGFRQGKWNPDLFLLLIEPTMYIIMALAERAGVEYSIDGKDTLEEEDMDREIDRKVNQIKETLKTSKVKKGVLPPEIETKIEQVPVESLISRPSETLGSTPETSTESLLSNPANPEVKEQ